MQVTIQYFALLREERGLSSESYETTAGTLQALYNELREKYGFSLPRESLRVAVNDEIRPWETPLFESADVVFIPPVAGG